MYRNPVYPVNFPDPFCLAFGGEYWCFGSGFWKDGRVFGVLHSTDLVQWKELAGAMGPLEDNPPFYWAPEVAYLDGHFYLYYSAGNEEFMHLRVAVADHPAGPFVDCGKQLTTEQFAIDAHVFVDEDGERYLFYASDHLERDRAGTGTVMDRLISPLQLAGSPSPVSLAAYDWQIYDPRREAKNFLRWHTIEGSFVLKHKGRYYQMFSGGNYQNISYGVSYAVTDDIQDGREWQQHSDGINKMPVLRSVPGHVRGPGHNSVVWGPDHRQLYCVYHVITAFEPLTRVMAIDRLEWVGDQLTVLGASYLPQPVPNRSENPLVQESSPGAVWSISTNSSRNLTMVYTAPYFLLHLYARAILPASRQQEAGDLPYERVFGIEWRDSNGQCMLRLTWLTARREMQVDWRDGRGQVQQERQAVSRLTMDQWHALQMELNGQWARLEIPGAAWAWEGSLVGRIVGAVFFVEDGTQEAGHLVAEFMGIGITYGSNDLFWNSPRDLSLAGWGFLPSEPMQDQPSANKASLTPGDGWTIQGDLLVGSEGQEHNWLVKDLNLADYEVVVNVRGADGSFLLCPALREGVEILPIIWVAQGALNIQHQQGLEQVLLEEYRDTDAFLHIRCRKEGDRLHVQVGRQVIGEYPAPDGGCRVGLGARQGKTFFDLVRITKLVV